MASKLARWFWIGSFPGGSIVATLLTLEVLLLSAWHGSWSALGFAPVAVWVVGAFVGGLGGLALALLVSRRFPKRSAKVSSGLIAPTLGIATLGILGVTQVNHLFLPHLLAPKSLVTNALLLGGCGAWCLLGIRRFIRDPSRGSALSVKSVGISAGMALVLALALPWTVTSAFKRAATPTLWQPLSEATEISPSEADLASPPRLLVLGLDGLRWSAVDPLIAAGELPNLASLVQRGIRGTLLADLESGQSPTLWSTIMTGRSAEEHGVLTHSRQRQVKALWNIFEDLGWSTFVVNVPGTFPADKLRGGMLAGFPLPQALAPNLGWRVLAGGVSDPRGPVPVPIEMPRPETRRRITLRGMSADFPLTDTTPFLLFWRLRPWLAQEIEQRLWARGVSYLGTPYIDLDLAITPGTIGSSRRIEAYAASTNQRLFSLLPGEWSPWLVAAIDGVEYVFRGRAQAADNQNLDLFFTSLFQKDIAGLASSRQLMDSLRSLDAPYVAEGTGTTIFYEVEALDALKEHQVDLASTRVQSVLRLMKTRSWDAFFYTFTVTERTHHPFWKFREPEPYRELARRSTSHPLYRSHLPSPEHVARFGEAIDSVYREVDQRIEQMLAHIDDSTTVVLLSDHGHRAGHRVNRPTAGTHHREGIYLVAGPTTARSDQERLGRLGPELTQIDIAPLILAHLGLSGAEDLSGRFPPELAPRLLDGTPAPLPEPVPSYEDSQARGGAEADGDEARAIEEQLRSLGYIS